MSVDPVAYRTRVRRPRTSFLALLASVSLASVGCVDQSTGPEGALVAHLSMATVFPQSASGQSAFLDAWRVQVIRSGEGVIGEDSGGIGPSESTIRVELTVELNALCETLAIRIELSSEGEVWFRSEDNHEVCSGTGNEVQTIEMEWVRPSPTVSPGSLAFTVQERRVASQSFTISYSGTGDLVWATWVQEGSVDWLDLQPTGGSATLGQPDEVTVTADATELTPGQYSAHIIVAADGFPEPIAQIPVNLTVTEGPRIELFPVVPLSFSVLSGLDPVPQTFTVTNSGGGILDWSASDDAGWMSVSPASGSLGNGQSQNVTVTVTSAVLEPGDYQATITVRDPNAGNSPKTLSVSLVVRQRAMIGLTPVSLSFSTLEGTDASEQGVEVANLGETTLNWTATDDAGWLSVEPSSGTLPYVPGVGGLAQTVTVKISSVSLDPGNYQATITFSDPEAGNSPQTLSVSLTVTPRVAPTISNLLVTLLQLNDSTCWNLGSRFEFKFDYADPDEDILIAGDSLAGTPITLQWQFKPEGNTGSGLITAGVEGTGSSGTARFQICVAYEIPGNTSVDIHFTLMDSGSRQSNQLVTNIPRPVGANSPPQASSPGNVTIPAGVLVTGGKEGI